MQKDRQKSPYYQGLKLKSFKNIYEPENWLLTSQINQVEFLTSELSLNIGTFSEFPPFIYSVIYNISNVFL